MPARFHPVSPAVWDRRFRRVSLEAKIVAFFVWTCRQRNSEGLFELAPEHVAADTRLDPDQVLDAFEELSAAEIIDYDRDAEVVLDREALRFNPLDKPSDNRIKGAVALFGQVPETKLRAEFVDLARRFSPPLAQQIIEQYGDTYLYVPSDPLASPSEAPTEPRVETMRGEGRREEQSHDHTEDTAPNEPLPCVKCGTPTSLRTPEDQPIHVHCLDVGATA